MEKEVKRYQKPRRKATWNNGGVCKTTVQSAAQVVPAVEKYHQAKQEEAAYKANMQHNWPKAYAYDRATGSGDWSDYEDAYGTDEGMTESLPNAESVFLCVTWKKSV